ncbi:MAG TPA: UvrD-helicase domain-containing protein [Candidatus Sulfotelmatobacter sp.]|jgi:DNA helicase-2/ATP-dependent DNA helicase PcrA|nr:UvrD-helicase domain-containing protein [Candidatus Sulfotelmatobacter sp.]
MTPPEQLLDRLNPAQREAVVHPGGPMLVLAGAGSGKTRVITHRIAWLVLERGVDPSAILAVTFTNKAAREMRERVEKILGAGARSPWIGTFHGLCLRMLRRDGTRVGLAGGFAIYDTDDQVALVRRILKDLAVDDAAGAARSFLSRISRAKNAMDAPESMAKRSFAPDARLTAEVYSAYVAGLQRANAVDFDDILLKALALLDRDEHPDVLERYASRCLHLLVDEYQDTNRPQYLLVKALSSAHRNICVVGDEDQSIYKFRGAEIRNILDFERDHPGAAVIKLEQNYRSTKTILDAAGAVIANNAARKGKTLWTENAQGDRIAMHTAIDDRSEAAWVARNVLTEGAGRPYEDVAVLYRTNAQSRSFEEVFRRDRIPYQIVGAMQFYERKEVKDVLAYLKLAVNPGDDVAFRRIVNVPPRALGDTSVDMIVQAAKDADETLLAASKRLVAERSLSPRAAKALAEFVDMMDVLSARAASEPAAVVVEGVVEVTGYEAFLEKSFPGEALDRIENVRALVSAAVEYEREADEPTLLGFLDRSALVSDADEIGARPGVTLMTAHNAKGLEFPVVFLAGLEENVFPHSRSRVDAEDLEEERRLCYVAITRAKEKLFLSRALQRLQQGIPMQNAPSRFLDEIPAHLLEVAEPVTGRGYDEPALRSGSSAIRAAARRTETAAPRFPSDMPPAEDGYSVGATVVHPMFGGGRVVDREGAGRNLKLTIQFPGFGTKKILPAYTQLQISGRS